MKLNFAARFLNLFPRPACGLLAVLAAASGIPTAPKLAAVPADPTPFEFVQPDGTRVMLRLRGDEYFHWYEDLKGFSVVRVGDAFYYARLDARGAMVETPWLAGRVDPAEHDLTPGELTPKDLRPRNRNDGQRAYRPWLHGASNPNTASASSGAAPGDATPLVAAKGTVKNLVILCRFSDHTVAAQGRPRSDFDTLFNKVGGDKTLAPTGSVRDAYSEMSYNTVSIDSTVVDWVALPQTMAYYAGSNNGQSPVPAPKPPADPQGYPNNTQKMVEDALAAADPVVDFSQFDTDNDGYVDAIDIIHSGYGAETAGAPANSIWSVKWSLKNDWTSADKNAKGVFVKVNNFHTEPALWGKSGTAITRIGVICHETGHFFGLPDLYDTDNSSDGIGSWCLMANSWGFDGGQTHPPHFSAWCKVFLGWVQPGLIETPGKYAIDQAEKTKSVYEIDRGFTAGEYLLIENRQPVGLENDMPQGGLLIWHIDESVSNNDNEGFPGQSGWPFNGNHYKVSLLQADGRYDLEKIYNASANARGDATDPYHADGTSIIGMNSTPNTDRYKSGTVAPTGIRIANISKAGETMTFDFSIPNRILFVDKFYTGAAITGEFDKPYKRIIDAYNAAVDGDTIVVRAADYFEAPLNGLGKRVTFDSHLGASSIR